jgi:hypothetical protein
MGRRRLPSLKALARFRNASMLGAGEEMTTRIVYAPTPKRTRCKKHGAIPPNMPVAGL